MATDVMTPGVVGAGAAPRRASFFRRNRGKIVLLTLLLALAAVAAAWTAATMAFNYSSGERVGYVQKLSKKGWLCQTWEGELAMTPVPGAAPEIFPFTVRDEKVAQQLSAAQGKKVSLHYDQKKGVPTSCFGESDYWVDGLRVVGN